MDPNQTLSDIRELVIRIQDAEDSGADQVEHVAMALAEKVNALDTWMSNGGFMPGLWEENRDKR